MHRETLHVEKSKHNFLLCDDESHGIYISGKIIMCEFDNSPHHMYSTGIGNLGHPHITNIKSLATLSINTYHKFGEPSQYIDILLYIHV